MPKANINSFEPKNAIKVIDSVMKKNDNPVAKVDTFYIVW